MLIPSPINPAKQIRRIWSAAAPAPNPPRIKERVLIRPSSPPYIPDLRYSPVSNPFSSSNIFASNWFWEAFWGLVDGLDVLLSKLLIEQGL